MSVAESHSTSLVQSALGFDFARVAFQPIYEPDGKLHGVEALMRFAQAVEYSRRNSQSGVLESSPISTEDVFQKARSSSWIMDLDFYCRKQIIEEAASQQWKNRLFINICPESLLSPQHSVGLTDELVELSGIRKDQVVLEITEETAIQNFDLFTRTIAHYRDQGYRIAIDDFGAGYAGLKMLASIQPDYLKIDRFFIQNIHREPVKYVIVENLVRICERLKIKVIAEGIETGAEFHSILNLGIDLRQGFYFGRPGYNLKEVEIEPG